MRCAVVLIVLAAACGGGPSEPSRPAGPAASPIATPAGAGDVVVATVNGRPIYGSCVTAQARGKTREAGLDECIAFELMAQEADARGLAADPQIIDATRTALVNRFVEVAYEAKYQTPADLASVIDQHIERNKHRLQRPEGRASTYVRINLPENAPPAEESAAREKMEKLAARLRDEAGLTTSHLEAIANEVLGDTKHEVAVVEFHIQRHLVPSYGNAVFAIPEIGRTTPNAVRTKFGWDVILLTDIAPAVDKTREDAANEMFPEVRRAYFNFWVDQIAKSLGVKIQKFDKAIAKLDEGETSPAAGSAE